MPGRAITCHFVEDEAQLQALAPAWRALPTPQPAIPAFLASAWFAHWRRCFGATTRNGVLAFRAGERLVGAMPFMIGRVARGPALSVQFDYRPDDSAFLMERPRYRIFRFGQASPAMALEAGMLRGGLRVEPGSEQACRRALLETLPALPGWSVAILPVPAGEAAEWTAALRVAGLRGYLRRGLIRFFSRERVPPFEELMRSRSRKFRKNIAHAVNHAQRQGLEVRVHVGPRDAASGLDALFAVARRSWKQTGRADLQFWTPPTPAVECFYGGLFRDESGELLPVVAMIYENGQPRAGMSAVVCQGVMLLCLTFFDPVVARIYPGRLLMKTLFEWAHAEGIGRIEFNATHEWTEPFSDRDDTYHQLLVFNTGPLAGALHRLSRHLSPVLEP